MRRLSQSLLVAAAVTLVANASAAQSGMEETRGVAGGGVHVKGWMGQIDPNETKSGQVLTNAKLAKDGKAMHVTTGPAVVYWDPKNKASGDYTVKATFKEPKFMNLNNHPHPYGIVVGGNDMGTDRQTYLYCAAYGTGNFIVRGFGPDPFQVNGRRGEANDAVNKAAGKGEPVTQQIAVTVKGDKVDCLINGKTVGSYNKTDVVGAGKLKSTDGVYGIRAGHNTEVLVTDLGMKKEKKTK